jgi:hypothetical protein
LVAVNSHGTVHALDNAMREILEKHYPQLAELHLEEFDVSLLHGGARDVEDGGAGALIRVLAIFSDGTEKLGNGRGGRGHFSGQRRVPDRRPRVETPWRAQTLIRHFTTSFSYRGIHA